MCPRACCARWNEQQTGVALTYNNDVDAYDAALGAEDTSRAAVVDLSHGGRVRVAGEGRRAFLVRETTYGGRPGELAMVGGAGEALDVALCVAQGRSEMLMVAPESRGDAARELQARVRGGEDVSVTDVSGATAQFAIVGEGATESLRSLLGQENAEAEAVLGGAVGDACMVGLEGAPCSLIRAEPLGPHTPVFMLVVDASVTAEAFAALCKAGCVPMGSNCFEKLRVRCGRPRRGFELGVAEAARTPLEANLWHACPAVEGSQESAAEASAGVAEVRQRAAARAMEHQLWSLELPVYVPPGDAVEVDGADQGMLTSVTQTPAGDIWALAYIKAKVGIADGDTVRVGTRRAVVRMPEYGSRRAA